MRKALAIVLDLRKGQVALTLARGMDLVDHALRVFSSEQALHVPLLRRPSESESSRLSWALGDFKLEEQEFLERHPIHRTLLEVLQERLPPHLLAAVPRSFDVIGQIAVIELPNELGAFSQTVGEAVLETCPNVRTVMAKAGAFSTEYRVRELRLAAGENNSVTEYKEHGCRYELDVREVFFSPRLSHERLRVASQIQPAETVVDMFAGVGPYSILIAKKQATSVVHAVELNPSAFKFLVSNILANRVSANVKPTRGDVRDVVRSRLSGVADRVVMNLPGKALDFVHDACLGLRKTGGVVNFYSFESGEKPEETASAKLRERVRASGRELRTVLATRIVKAVAPYRVQVAVDAVVR